MVRHEDVVEPDRLSVADQIGETLGVEAAVGVRHHAVAQAQPIREIAGHRPAAGAELVDVPGGAGVEELAEVAGARRSDAVTSWRCTSAS